MKKCPFCAEEIQDEAIKCRFCGEMLQQTRKVPWYFSSANLFVSFLFVGPLMLPLLWMHPKMSRNKKLAYTALTVLATAALGALMAQALKPLREYYEIIANPTKALGG